uniref:PDZ domain-containing protein n=2 Tax=Photinus pyralis TaxID=7054 RepID=A0A1Y1KPL3_PHOPY
MASVGFRWLDILEKEFDKAFVDLDLAIGELDPEELDIVYRVRQKLCTLSSCFAQLTHKSQTIFQSSAKIEAELIHMRAELIESRAKRELLEQELHNLLLQLHTSQLSQLPTITGNKVQNSKFEPDASNIKKKFENEIKSSPTHNLSNGAIKEKDELKFSPALVELAQYRAENSQLQLENGSLRNSIVALNSEVYGAKLAAQYLDKELAGRIQQLQLLGREMQGDVRNKLWRQLESEILLQRHKTVVRACRRNSILSNHSEVASAKPSIPVINEENTQHFGDVRTVMVKRKNGQGLGISITGGREHGVPILISELEPNGPAAMSGQLYIGDAILYVNDRDLRQACHREAVDILQQQTGDCRLQVQYIAADDSDNSLEEDGFNFRFFDNEVCDPNDLVSLHPLHSSGLMNTPTAPRTPESTNSR